MLAGGVGFGLARLSETPPTAPLRTALIASDAFEGTGDNWREVWAHYEPGIKQAAEDNLVYLVVLPEKLFRVDESQTAAMLDAAVATAEAADVDLVFGVDARAGGVASNRAYLVTRDGTVSFYDKRHLIPGFEDVFTPGERPLTQQVVGVRVGLLICKDLDFPETVRAAANSTGASSGVSASMLAVPAWDFNEDAWFHSRIAVLRGVENGVSVARSAREGVMTVSDQYGRIIGEGASASASASTSTSTSEDPAVVVADVPNSSIRTVYSSVGDLFGWLSLGYAVAALGAVGVVGLRRRRRSTSTSTSASTTPSRAED